MAGNFNRVFLMGNLTRDPEIRHTGNNMAIAKLGLAVNRRYRTADGQVKEETTFVDCDAFGKTAETIGKFLTKGRPIFIEGHLRLDTWQDKQSGENRSKLKVVVDNFQFVDSKGGGGGAGGGGQGADDDAPAPQVRAGRGGAAAPTGGGDPSIESDDIPF